MKWLRETAATLEEVVAPVLGSLLDRYELYHHEQHRLDRAIQTLSRTDRYRAACDELRLLSGVGLLSAMTFLTEMGDVQRFRNRREVAAYVDCVPPASSRARRPIAKGESPGKARLAYESCCARPPGRR